MPVMSEEADSEVQSSEASQKHAQLYNELVLLCPVNFFFVIKRNFVVTVYIERIISTIEERNKLFVFHSGC